MWRLRAAPEGAIGNETRPLAGARCRVARGAQVAPVGLWRAHGYPFVGHSQTHTVPFFPAPPSSTDGLFSLACETNPPAGGCPAALSGRQKLMAHFSDAMILKCLCSLHLSRDPALRQYVQSPENVSMPNPSSPATTSTTSRRLRQIDAKCVKLVAETPDSRRDNRCPGGCPALVRAIKRAVLGAEPLRMVCQHWRPTRDGRSRPTSRVLAAHLSKVFSGSAMPVGK
jgi:hypothetical protein